MPRQYARKAISTGRRRPPRIQRQRPDHNSRRLISGLVIAYRNGPRRCTVGRRHRRQRRREHPARGPGANTTPAVILNVQRQPGAKCHRPWWTTSKTLLPQTASHSARGGRCRGADRPHHHHPCLGDRRRVRAGAFRRPGRAGDLSCSCATCRRRSSPVCPLPLSLVGTLAAMYLLGFSLDNLSLMALTISTGLRGRRRHRHDRERLALRRGGEAPLAAALKARADRLQPIISWTFFLVLSLIAVLIPLLFMGDVVGRLFHEFASRSRSPS